MEAGILAYQGCERAGSPSHKQKWDNLKIGSPLVLLALHNCGIILSKRINYNPRVCASLLPRVSTSLRLHFFASPHQPQSSQYSQKPYLGKATRAIVTINAATETAGTNNITLR